MKPRVSNKEQGNDDAGYLNYDAIPFEFHLLREPLADNAQIIPLVYNWFALDWLYKWEGSRLLKIVFMQLEAVLQNFLIDKVKSGAREDAVNVLEILNQYEGHVGILPVCIEVITKYSDDENLMANVHRALDATGVVMGEYGFRDAYKGKLSFVEEMLKDKDENVKAFANEHKAHLEQRIEAEHLRATRDIEVRKKVWGVNEDSE